MQSSRRSISFLIDWKCEWKFWRTTSSFIYRISNLFCVHCNWEMWTSPWSQCKSHNLSFSKNEQYYEKNGTEKCTNHINISSKYEISLAFFISHFAQLSYTILECSVFILDYLSHHDCSDFMINQHIVCFYFQNKHSFTNLKIFLCIIKIYQLSKRQKQVRLIFINYTGTQTR